MGSTKNSKIFEFLEPNFSFMNSKNSGYLLIFQCRKFQKFPKFYNFENRQISNIDKFIKQLNFWKCLIPKISKFSKFVILETYQNSKNFQFSKLSYVLSVRKV